MKQSIFIVPSSTRAFSSCPAQQEHFHGAQLNKGNFLVPSSTRAIIIFLFSFGPLLHRISLMSLWCTIDLNIEHTIKTQEREKERERERERYSLTDRKREERQKESEKKIDRQRETQAVFFINVYNIWNGNPWHI